MPLLIAPSVFTEHLKTNAAGPISSRLREQCDGAGDVEKANCRGGARSQEDPNVPNLHGPHRPNVEVHELNWQLPCVKAVQASNCPGTDHLSERHQCHANAQHRTDTARSMDQCQL